MGFRFQVPGLGSKLRVSGFRFRHASRVLAPSERPTAERDRGTRSLGGTVLLPAASRRLQLDDHEGVTFCHTPLSRQQWVAQALSNDITEQLWDAKNMFRLWFAIAGDGGASLEKVSLFASFLHSSESFTLECGTAPGAEGVAMINLPIAEDVNHPPGGKEHLKRYWLQGLPEVSCCWVSARFPHEWLRSYSCTEYSPVSPLEPEFITEPTRLHPRRRKNTGIKAWATRREGNHAHPNPFSPVSSSSSPSLLLRNPFLPL